MRIYARGWIEPFRGEIIEGFFVAEGFEFEGLQLIADGEYLGVCPWSQITGVTMRRRTDLPQAIRDRSKGILSKTTDPNVFMGWLSEEKLGLLSDAVFVLVPAAQHTWRDWQHTFVNAGLLPPRDGHGKPN